MTSLALLYHPDKGGQAGQMSRVNAAYERAQTDTPRLPSSLGKSPLDSTQQVGP
jgi:hypothetical protein